MTVDDRAGQRRKTGNRICCIRQLRRMHVQHHPGRSQIAILGRVEPEHRVVALADVVEANRQDSGASPEAGAGRPDLDGLSPACFGRREPQDVQVHHRHAGGNAYPCRKACPPGSWLPGRAASPAPSPSLPFSPITRQNHLPFIVGPRASHQYAGHRP